MCPPSSCKPLRLLPWRHHTFGFLEQLIGELDHLDHLHPREAFAHGKDDALVEGIQQDASAGVSHFVKLFPVQQSPEVLPTFWFLRGMT